MPRRGRTEPETSKVLGELGYASRRTRSRLSVERRVDQSDVTDGTPRPEGSVIASTRTAVSIQGRVDLVAWRDAPRVRASSSVPIPREFLVAADGWRAYG